MTTLTGSPANAPAAPRPRGRGLRLSGVTWLVWRQHRAAFWTLLALAVLGVALIAYYRMGLMEYLDRFNWPHPKATDDWETGWPPYGDQFDGAGTALVLVPVLLGVFVGAPLLAGDLENGTAKLVTAQAVTRVRWLSVKLGMTALVVTVGTTALSLAFAWWWAPVKEVDVFAWYEIYVFNNTGPVPAALSLLSVVGGVAIGMLLRRTLIAMVVTLGFAVAVQIVWATLLIDLGNSVRLVSKGITWESHPALSPGAYEMDRSYVTGSGELLGYSTCVREPSEAAMAACQKKADLVGWSTEYLPISQMAGMQWFGAAILLTLTAAIAAFILLWGRKRLV